MIHFKFARTQASIFMIVYGIFCAAVIGMIFWTENFLFQKAAVGSAGIIPLLRWLVLFVMGLPVIVLSSRRHRDQEKLVRIDDATGLCNRRQLLATLEQEFRRARRYSRELSVMMIDVDNFKSINDTYGHLAGDRILKEIGSILWRSVRAADVVGRYGGDEFLAILPETAHESAKCLALRLWVNVVEHPFRIEKKVVHVSVSLGVSSLQDLRDGADISNLIDRADQAMLNAKNPARERAFAA